LRAVERHRVTVCFMVPAFFIRILELPADELARADLSSLRLILHAAAPCPLPVKRQMLDLLPHVDIWEFYGATEGGATRISSADWRTHPGSVGTPWPGVEVLIVDDNGERVAPGVSGRVFIRPPGGQRFQYHNDQAKTDGAWLGDAFTVGDVGHLDDDGYLYLTDRRDFMIVAGGVNIYPQEAENLLVTHPRVLDAAVFGIPDAEMGERVHAVVQPVEPATAGPELERELMGFCRANLAHYKCPRAIDFEAELPRQPTGKLYKRLLRDRYWGSKQSRIV
jgi:acyl-coenzyme A synthetase/AMP-(fatty) acid ligase